MNLKSQLATSIAFAVSAFTIAATVVQAADITIRPPPFVDPDPLAVKVPVEPPKPISASTRAALEASARRAEVGFWNTHSQRSSNSEKLRSLDKIRIADKVAIKEALSPYFTVEQLAHASFVVVDEARGRQAFRWNVSIADKCCEVEIKIIIKIGA